VTRSGDGYDEMTRGLDEHGRSSTPGVPDDLTLFLHELRLLGNVEPPEPSDEVAALLGAPRSLASRRALRVLMRSGLVAAALALVLVAAAASHSLPQPAQRVVSHVVNVLTPFQITPRKATQPLVPAPPPVVPTTSAPPSHPRASRTAHRVAPVPAPVPVPVPPVRSSARAGDDGGDAVRPSPGDDQPAPGSDDGSSARNDDARSAAPTARDDGGGNVGGDD
jgi:hypothetical protein